MRIQLLSLDQFSAWPGIGSSLPLDVQPAAGRIAAIWPNRIIWLDSRGRADRATLLAFFAASSARWINGAWNPENGLLCSDGIWRALIPGVGLYELNLSTGAAGRISEPRLIPGALHPGPEGSVIIRGKEGSMTVRPGGEVTALPAIAPRSPLAAVSSGFPKLPRAAWISPEDGALYTGGFRMDASLLGGDVNWSMDWWGQSVVIGRSGYLLVVTPGGGGQAENSGAARRIEDPRIPRRWYRVRGAEGRLILHSPERPEALIITRASSEPAAPAAPADAVADAPADAAPAVPAAAPADAASDALADAAPAVPSTAPADAAADAPADAAPAVPAAAPGDAASASPADSPEDAPPAAPEDVFPALLKAHVLEAGLYLETGGHEAAAEAFYGWSLPLIRENRSRRPLDAVWARLEGEVTARRSRLRERL